MAQLLFYRYCDAIEAAMIAASRTINRAPHQVCKYFTPDLYHTGANAQQFLALPYTPTHRVGPIPLDEMPDFDYVILQVVAPAFGQPGGGLEVATTIPLYLFSITPIP